MSQLPSYFDDEILGRMEYNPDLSWYEGWLDNERIGLPAEISLPAKTQFELAANTELLRRAVKEAESLVNLAKQSAQQTFFDNGYLDDPAINADTFHERLELTTLWIDDNGGLALSFSTDEMFPGHAIRVNFDSAFSNATSTLW